jgi:hypothetical protein
MEIKLSDVLSVIAVTVSFLTLIITIYYKYIKKGKIKVLAADRMQLLYGPNRKAFSFTVALSIFNIGARAIGVVRLHGFISSGDQKNAVPFEWDAFAQGTNLAQGAGYKPFTEFTGYAEPIIVQGYSAESRTVHFVTLKPYLMTAGVHTIILDFLTGPNYKKSYTLRIPLSINQDVSNFLYEKCVCDDKTLVSKSSCWYTRKS